MSPSPLSNSIAPRSRGFLPENLLGSIQVRYMFLNKVLQSNVDLFVSGHESLFRNDIGRFQFGRSGKTKDRLQGLESWGPKKKEWNGVKKEKSRSKKRKRRWGWGIEGDGQVIWRIYPVPYHFMNGLVHLMQPNNIPWITILRKSWTIQSIINVHGRHDWVLKERGGKGIFCFCLPCQLLVEFP